MDRQTASYYELVFKLKFLESVGMDFQDFFSDLMEKAYPSDFVRVRPWGREGDRKNDGYLHSQRTLFQVYAPLDMTATSAVSKIREDFEGALPHWRNYYSTWIFVHNSKKGLPPHVLETLLKLGENPHGIVVKQWGYEELLLQLRRLPETSVASLLGPCPFSGGRLPQPRTETIGNILRHLGRISTSASEPIRTVPQGKLNYNQLSDAARALMQAAMARSMALRLYFERHPDPAFRDEVAEGFRQRYRELYELRENPDDIFGELWVYAGGWSDSSPDHQSAVYAILAYFFEACDIFERPPEGWA